MQPDWMKLLPSWEAIPVLSSPVVPMTLDPSCTSVNLLIDFWPFSHSKHHQFSCSLRTDIWLPIVLWPLLGSVFCAVSLLWHYSSRCRVYCFFYLRLWLAWPLYKESIGVHFPTICTICTLPSSVAWWNLWKPFWSWEQIIFIRVTHWLPNMLYFFPQKANKHVNPHSRETGVLF